MSFTNIKANNQGFTIVELLIVVVVIAILAAITIVSYNGITNRANASSAASNVETVLKIAESYNADAGRYPGTKAAFSSGFTDATITTAASKLPAGITILNPAITAASTPATIAGFSTGVLTASDGTNKVEVYMLGATGSSTGGVIVSWDYETKSRQAAAKFTYYGAASSSSTFNQLPN